MTTTIERPDGEDRGSGGVIVIGILVGAIATLAIGMIVFGGAFDSAPGTTQVTIQTPAPSSPAVPESVPQEAQPTPAPVQ